MIVKAFTLELVLQFLIYSMWVSVKTPFVEMSKLWFNANKMNSEAETTFDSSSVKYLMDLCMSYYQDVYVYDLLLITPLVKVANNN